MWTEPKAIAPLLQARHYLGPTRRGWAWQDTHGCLVLAAPTSRRLPVGWLELTRWCLLDGQGSRQWAAVRAQLMNGILPPGMRRPTTVVSYSDPSVGHTGALYRACNWIWAPTWHRLRPPPTGNGAWSQKAESVKDRWVDCLLPDSERFEILRVKDTAVVRRLGDYTEPVVRRGKVVRGTGGMKKLHRPT